MGIIKKKKIKVPIYDQFTLTMFISDNLVEDVEAITKSKFEYGFGGMFFYKKNSCDLLIGIEKDSLSNSLIAHECFHATRYILEYVGITLEESSEEAFAYLLGYLVEEVDKLVKSL